LSMKLNRDPEVNHSSLIRGCLRLGRFRRRDLDLLS
jgi:hypothetical protein